MLSGRMSFKTEQPIAKCTIGLLYSTIQYLCMHAMLWNDMQYLTMLSYTSAEEGAKNTEGSVFLPKQSPCWSCQKRISPGGSLFYALVWYSSKTYYTNGHGVLLVTLHANYH